MVKCPFCNKFLKKVAKEWDYSHYHVKSYDCDDCGKNIREYYKKGKFSHTIPKT